MSKFTVEVTVPKGLKEGDVFSVTVEAPAAEPKKRGQLNGIALAEMSDEQLKIELINSKSVLYKAQKRNADAETIAKNQARVDAALAEKASRTPVTIAATVADEQTTSEPETNEGEADYAEI